MILEQFSIALTAFREAFPAVALVPLWADYKWLNVEAMLQAIREVAADPLTKHRSPDVIVRRVLWRSRELKPCCQRCGSYDRVTQRAYRGGTAKTWLCRVHQQKKARVFSGRELCVRKGE